MTVDQVRSRLESLGTAQNRKIYARHGVRDDAYGVSYANLKSLAKQIGTDDALADRLWRSGNHDAAVLATFIADPAALTEKRAKAWASDLDSYVITDAFSGLAARSPAARVLADSWIGSSNEWIASAGWNVLAVLAGQPKSMSDDELAPYIARIEHDIYGAKNRVRYAMNGALIAIGGYRSTLRDAAIAAADRIGEVVVDHGETGCKTPDAADYIRKMAADSAAKAERPGGSKPAGAAAKKKTARSGSRTAGKSARE